MGCSPERVSPPPLALFPAEIREAGHFIIAWLAGASLKLGPWGDAPLEALIRCQDKPQGLWPLRTFLADHLGYDLVSSDLWAFRGRIFFKGTLIAVVEFQVQDILGLLNEASLSEEETWMIRGIYKCTQGSELSPHLFLWQWCQWPSSWSSSTRGVKGDLTGWFTIL